MDIWAYLDPTKMGVLCGGLLLALWSWWREK
jgi:hypothetical protein